MKKQHEIRNLSMVMDFYEMTMANGYFASRDTDTLAVFDVFYRKNPDNAGFAIFAGLEQIIDYINNLHFEEEDIAYLREQNLFSEEFLDYLRNYRFHGDIYAMPEGTIIYPYEPLITVVAPLLDAQLIETALLLEVNHQSLIATKANRIVRAAKGRAVSDFGARRAHNVDAAVYGARAAYIGGVVGTATVFAGELFDIPISGTMAHSWVMFCDSEDQLACSLGHCVYVDFNTNEITPITADFTDMGLTLCLTNTGGSHAGLDSSYARIPADMVYIANLFDKGVLADVDPAEFYAKGWSQEDRPVRRAMHFFQENERVPKMRDALIAGDGETYMKLMNESGRSSEQLLNNIVTSATGDTKLAEGLELSRTLLEGKGAWRVHGGGFAGCVQALMPTDYFPTYKEEMEKVFGEGTCTEIKLA